MNQARALAARSLRYIPRSPSAGVTARPLLGRRVVSAVQHERARGLPQGTRGRSLLTTSWRTHFNRLSSAALDARRQGAAQVKLEAPAGVGPQEQTEVVPAEQLPIHQDAWRAVVSRTDVVFQIAADLVTDWVPTIQSFRFR